MKKSVSVALACIFAMSATAGTQPYAGQDSRNIASLSDSDVAALLAGEGWGLAKPAELNGYPGPAHVLELADQLDLTAEQRAKVEAIFADMQAKARLSGAAYVDAEQHLSMMFDAGHATPDRLTQMLETSANALADLRAVHLAAHLATTPILTAHQKHLYDNLRGYGDPDHSGGGHSHDKH